MLNIKKLSQYIQLDEFFYQKNEVINPHSSLWGEFNLSLNGILKYQIEQQSYLSPPQYGLWIPPQTAHTSIAIDCKTTRYVCIRLHPELSPLLGTHINNLHIRPFLRALIIELLLQKNENRQQHLLTVLLDELNHAPRYEHYLPSSHHPILAPILAKLSDAHLFHYSLQHILQESTLSERHLLRLSQQELQLSLSEWRNRAKIMYAINQLHQGNSVKSIALDLGYQHPSSFTDFFKRYTGLTPVQFLHA